MRGDGYEHIPVFPHIYDVKRDEAWTDPVRPGMSLRDWFAGQALAGYIASHSHPQALNAPQDEDAAHHAYWYADAMLAAREKDHE